MSDEIVALYSRSSAVPPPFAALGDDDLLALYAPDDREAPRVRANFITSVDGSASADGLSAQLGAPADKRVFDLLRRLADVVVVGAGTVRAEGYGALRLDDPAVAWRRARGMRGHPSFAIVSARLELDPHHDIFTKAPVRPLVLTLDSHPGPSGNAGRNATADDGEAAALAARRSALSNVADVIGCGVSEVEPRRLVDALVTRGLSQIHCEGGPALLGALIDADELDELCLTFSPNLEGGVGPRIVHPHSEYAGLRALTLEHLLRSGSMLLSRYSRGAH